LCGLKYYVAAAHALRRPGKAVLDLGCGTGVLGEACRCVESGGLVTVLEPDLARLEVTSDVLAPGAGWLSGVAHPVVGGELWRLVEEAGCQVLDRVEELSVWRSLATLESVTGFPASVDRAVAVGPLGAGVAQSWVEEQR
jgi:hypothetical protein